MTDSLPDDDRIHQPMKHQPDRVNIDGVVRVGVALAAAVLVAMLGMVILFRGLEKTDDNGLPKYATLSQDIDPNPPRLDPDQSAHLRELRAEHRRVLSSYEWIDQEAGIARIPIERAIDIVANELPARNDDE